MPIEVLSRDYAVQGVETSPRAIMDKRAREHALDEKVAANDSGFFGVMLEDMRSSMIVHSVEKYPVARDRVITADMRADAPMRGSMRMDMTGIWTRRSTRGYTPQKSSSFRTALVSRAGRWRAMMLTCTGSRRSVGGR
jgi:hypothetical protein